MTTTLPISLLGNPVLRQVAQPIADVREAWVQTLVADLIATLQQANGVGIAAPQVGQSYRVLVVASSPNPRYPHAPKMEPLPMINPQILSRSEELEKDWEGCLSVPGIRGFVPRHRAIAVEYTSLDGQRQHREFEGFVARIVQHEFDHLEGLVFLDRLESVQEIISNEEYLKFISELSN